MCQTRERRKVSFGGSRIHDSTSGIALTKSIGSVISVGLPRAGRRSLGVPVGGAFDSNSLRVANALVGQLDGAKAWELAMGTASFTANRRGWVAITGAVATCRIGAWSGLSNVVRSVEPGDVIFVDQPIQGCRIYVQFGEQGRSGRVRSPDFSSPIGILRGPDFDLLGNEPPESAVTSRQMNRIGVRLEPLETFQHSYELTSKPQTPGSIQVTPAGELIVIGPDGPVTGGYPQAFVIGRAWLSSVAQWQPGQRLQFSLISSDQARLAWHTRELEMESKLRDYRLSIAT